VAHGYAAVDDVDARQLRDNMDSFFLAETLKYLYLLFDEDNIVARGRCDCAVCRVVVGLMVPCFVAAAMCSTLRDISCR
jgi:hypothetical protein